ncbi:maltose O-acetyltransferase [Sporobacter termitidis DSM 10068]|uniref:Acetyltransferase n=1 Tax=Sporobacter termitidis DSM 10068 TaxID=1123282 RepID=A0A1M5Y5X5_9FIRM|nr:sugar O-acetyltransferase [Sporobacter termitidis]SHI07475.1 maltose O-acetyltransferase [Sporobacter termitidis DSM 10068]
MTEKEKMLAGKLYIARDEALMRDNKNARRLTRLFNQTGEDEADQRVAYLKELFGATGENIWIEPAFHCDYGRHIYVGENFYANYDCIIIDVCPVTIGDNVFFGPRVGVYTAAHPIDAEVRATGLEYGKPVAIGNDVWVGGNTVINPGVTIGSNVVIGSGAIVTKDIPSGVIAAGNPCKTLRSITDEDRRYWHMQREEYMKDAGK